jgi:hypothetical protein
VVTHYFSYFVRGDALVEVIARLDKYGWTNRAGAYAACSCNLAFFFRTELFNSILEGFENFQGAKGNTAA